MALYNEILVGRYNRLLQKLFQMKGGPPAAQLSGDIQVNFNLFNGVENRYLESWNRFGIRILAAAGGAGLRSAIELTNLAPTNVIAVIEKITITETVALNFPTLTLGTSQPTNLVASGDVANRLDSRSPLRSSLLSQVSTNAGAIPGTTIWRGVTPVNSFVDVIHTQAQEIPLLPTQALDIWSNVLNQQIEASIFWRERFLEESERS